MNQFTKTIYFCYNVKHPLIQTSIDFKPHNFAAGMRKFLLYYFLFATIFVSSLRAFSLNTTSNHGLKTFRSKCYFNSKFSKTASVVIFIDVINDFGADDEENLTTTHSNFGALLPAFQSKSQILVNSDYRKPRTLAYFFTNLSRIPRFNFLSLNVIRI